MIEGRGFTLSSIICELWDNYKVYDLSCHHFKIGVYNITFDENTLYNFCHIPNDPRRFTQVSYDGDNLQDAFDSIATDIKLRINHDRRSIK